MCTKIQGLPIGLYKHDIVSLFILPGSDILLDSLQVTNYDSL